MSTLKRLAGALAVLGLLTALIWIPASAQNNAPQIALRVMMVEMTGEVSLNWWKPDSMHFQKYYVLMSRPGPGPAVVAVLDSADGSATSMKVLLPAAPVDSTVFYNLALKGVRGGGMDVYSNMVTVAIKGPSTTNAFRLDGKLIDGNKVLLRWTRPPQVEVIQYLVYRALLDPNRDGPVVPEVIATTTDTTIIDTAVAPGAHYDYFVSAQTMLTVMIVSTHFHIWIPPYPPVDKIKFVTEPIRTARIGVLYRYDADAISLSSAAVIRYAVRAISPASNAASLPLVTIDSVTGVVTFMPIQKGVIGISIIARSSLGGFATQDYSVSVSGGVGVLVGRVTDTLNNPLQPVLIQAYRRDANACMTYQAKTDSLGKYRIVNMDPGSYYVHAIPFIPGFLEQWYNGADNAHDATPITVPDTPSVAVADFKLRQRPVTDPYWGTVEGTVHDTAGIPIVDPSTTVYFVNVDFAMNNKEYMRLLFDNDPATDHRLMGVSRFVYRFHVDSVGFYAGRVVSGRYIAFARSRGYSVSFYDGHDNILEADVIYVPPVISMVPYKVVADFALAPLPPVLLGSINGHVIDTVRNIGVRSRMFAFRDRWTLSTAYPFRYQRVYWTDTDSLGEYTFTDLLPGSYIVLAVPLGRYAPAFYHANDQAQRWYHATRIPIFGNSVTGIDIYVRPLPELYRGFTSIAGRVARQSGTGIAGAFIFAQAADGSIAGYGLTDAQGNYVISDLAPGTYTVIADAPGFDISGPQEAVPTYNAGLPVEATISFTAQEVTNVPDDGEPSVPTEFTLQQNYPNPFNPSTVITYAVAEAGRSSSVITLKVYDLLGREVATLANGPHAPGAYQVTFDASQLTTGVYFYQLRSESGTMATRKMVLIK